MITFFRTDDCRECDAIQEALEEMSLAHKVVRLPSDELPSGELPEGTRPPVLVDDGRCFEGDRQIRRHLHRLRDFKAEWDKFQSDACYCDDDGNVI